jgi:hypothetical protein
MPVNFIFLSVTCCSQNFSMPSPHPKATEEVLQYIDGLPPFSKAICKKLRAIILKADKELVEDWKWGPNYYLSGMVCG